MKLRILILSSGVFFMIVIILFILTTSSHGERIIVDDDGIPTRSCDYTYIQEAIDNANSGDTIIISNGNYHENINLDKTLIIKGENWNNTIIDNSAISIHSDFCIITELFLNNTLMNNRGGNNILISKCIFYNNNRGFQTSLSSNNGTIRDCIFSNSSYAGIDIQNSINWLITNCLFHNISGYAISIHGEAVVSYCTIRDCNQGVGLLSNYITLANSSFERNYCGIRSCSNYEGQTICYNNIIDSRTYDEGIGDVTEIYHHNYWDSYSGEDTDGDGIGDTPYTSYRGPIDLYPLIEPNEEAGWTHPNEINRDIEYENIALLITQYLFIIIIVVLAGVLLYQNKYSGFSKSRKEEVKRKKKNE